MPTRAEIAASFDAIAEGFDASRPRPWRATIEFESRLPRGARVLDLGCGAGRNLAFLRERGHRVVGLDASAGLLSRVAAKTGTKGLVRGDLVSLPFRAETFDAVHCVATLHHLPSADERRQSVDEAVRGLHPRGIALFTVWAHEQPRFEDGPRDVDVPWRRSDGLAVPRFYHLFRTGELEDLLVSSGLAVMQAGREEGDHVAVAAKP